MISFTEKQCTDDPDWNAYEPSTKKRKLNEKSFKSVQNSLKTQKTDSVKVKTVPFNYTKPQEATITTEETFDENIFPEATYQSYDEFEQKFNIWKAKYLHPFRVASSEALRTEEGQVSERFKYRYVVYHCARFGNPRMRGEGKRPNQNYLPCNCTAMIRLNFNYHEQCLKLTSVQTRHQNHSLDKDLYDRMIKNEGKRRTITPRRRTIGALPMTVPIKKEVDEEADSEHSQKSRSKTPPSNYRTPPINKSGFPNQVLQYLTPPHIQNYVPPNLMVPRTSDMMSPVSSIPTLHEMQRMQNHTVVNRMNVFVTAPYPINPNWTTNPLPLSSQASTASSSQISPISSTVDENEAPKRFHTLETVRPIPLLPSENTAFHQMIHESTRVSPIPKVEIESMLASVSRMLLDVNLPPDVLQNRIRQLNHLISQWSY
ncbi:hypothetical protein CAEBREN_01096 [Caenorhabditis brenneri]|uniref:ZSWIM3 N-terminal domain-containing protein n=1 Tax=Caenorhabditis brenneri TaxID=135651 RepID=G0MYW1_CAEBE|nr:hypothetical protein CAEBREN_01096 [Caenorhabditis brenneri]